MSLLSEHPIPSPDATVDPLRNSQETGQVDAVILAGGSAEAIDSRYPAKGLILVAGRPLVAWVAATLREARSIRRIVAVLPCGEADGIDLSSWTALVDQVVVHDGSFSENIGAGLGALPKDLQVVGVTGDIPALTPEAIDDLVAQTLARKAAVSYALISESDMAEQFPGSLRTFFRLKSGRYTGGNAMLGDPRLYSRVNELTQKLFETRKSPLKMLRLIGLPFVIKLALGRLEPRDVEKKLTQLIDAPCAAVYTRYANIGADVDKPADIGPIERVLENRK
ncbi:MAG: nucleotidyltransferase family protein [Actinomycetia bacterium]|nr:nucleotidyltransferase family protein [Actinomycetes bacterium]